MQAEHPRIVSLAVPRSYLPAVPGGTVHRCVAVPYLHPLQLWPIAGDASKSHARSHNCQLRNLFVHSSPSRLGIADETILRSTATLMLFSHIVVVIRPPRG